MFGRGWRASGALLPDPARKFEGYASETEAARGGRRAGFFGGRGVRPDIAHGQAVDREAEEIEAQGRAERFRAVRADAADQREGEPEGRADGQPALEAAGSCAPEARVGAAVDGDAE